MMHPLTFVFLFSFLSSTKHNPTKLEQNITCLRVNRHSQYGHRLTRHWIDHQRPNLNGNGQSRDRIRMRSTDRKYRSSFRMDGHGHDGHVETVDGVGDRGAVFEVALAGGGFQFGFDGVACVGIGRVRDERD